MAREWREWRVQRPKLNKPFANNPAGNVEKLQRARRDTGKFAFGRLGLGDMLQKTYCNGFT